ncbi:MAG: cell surface protein SprA [Bacteroidota bacterium]|nr:cell surface protein SprA [Bacteroidota bacterium]MDP4289356.1 cell surface protein SprA [Bacteroidota bacterium]
MVRHTSLARFFGRDFAAPHYAVVLVLVSMLGLSACKRAKETQKERATPGVVDTSNPQDTSKSIFEQKYDSLSHKVSNLFNQLFGKDTTKGYPVTAPPLPEQPSPVVTEEPLVPPGFLKPEVTRKTEYDSSGNVTQRDVFLGSDVRIPSSYSFEDYLRKSQENSITAGFEKTLHHQLDTGKSVEASTGILGDYGNISIPIPPSIVPTIFGRPSINLRVNGDVAIHLAYRDQQTYATTGTNFYGSETGLDFKQEINVSTNGTIGDKLKIGADWGSDRMFQFDNLLKFNYVGYPDEILQTFDAGNVTFNTPSKYIGIQNDLFGLKAVTRFGPVYVTALAAQKKGERQNRSFGGGAGTAVEHVIKPWEYRRNRFWLDTAYIKYYEPYCAAIPRDPGFITKGGGEYIPDGLSSGRIEVWVQTNQQTNDHATTAVAWYNLPLEGSGYAPSYRNMSAQGSNDVVQAGYWLKMDSTRYTYDPYTGILILNQEPDDQQFALAVSFPVYKNNAPFDRYGEAAVGGQGPIVLKLLKPRATFKNPTFAAWKNVVKNTYYMGGQAFTDKDFSLRILYQNPRGGQDEYIQTAGKPPFKKQMKAISILGLDRYSNSSGQSDPTPDGLTDFGQQFVKDDFIIDPKSGTLVFPYIEPFGEHMKRFNDVQKTLDPVKFKPDSNFYIPEIYNTEQERLRNTETKQTSINIKFSGGVSSTLVLNAFNLVEGSVKVTSGATQLTEGKDYRVDYASGTVTILNPDYVTGASALNVEYDVHDIFTNATKNVLGFRAEVPLIDASNVMRGSIGTTFMNYSMHLPTLKTRQGEEPLSNWIWGFDAGYKFDMPMITDALNALPIFNLKDKSELSVKADAAISLPNPNTEKSPMAVDNGASIAYLDDFEGGLNEFPLYTNYGRWHPSSQPADSAMIAKYPGTDTNYWSNPINRIKGKMTWCWPAQFPAITDIKPNKSVAPGTTAQTMNISFDPTRPGIYNPNPSNVPNPDKWGGMVQYAPGLNVAATNTDAIQVWIKVDNLDDIDRPNAKLRLDIGRVSEDVIPNGRLDNEDINNSGRYDPNEDLGLDGMDDAAEQAKFQSLNITPWNPADPNNDDYGSDCDHINGQEGNSTDAQAGLKPDNEDLDGNGAVNLDNSYYEYEIPLDMTQNTFQIGNTNNTWYQLRIPLADFKRIIGTQDTTFSNISYYRFWMDGVQKPVALELYELMLVGSQWTRGPVGLSTSNPIGDTSLRISYVSVEDNQGPPTNYTGPPDVQRDIIPGQTTTLLGNEQSLNMMLRKVPIGTRREAQRIFPSPNDLFNYRAMAIWVHGDQNPGTQISDRPLNSINDTINRTWVYFRFGTDQYNYYEYRRPLVRGWQNIHVDFNTLTALKAKRQSKDYIISAPVNDGVFGSLYTVVGSPTLTNAQYFVLGADHEDHTIPVTGDSLSTDIWWDELRLLDANDNADYSYTGAAELKLAEFGRVMGGMTNERPDFHRVDERFNYGRSLNLMWNVTGEFAMQKVLPKWMEDRGSKLPITISHAESVVRPKYIANTDINLSTTVAALQADAASNPALAASDLATADSLQLNNETLQVKNSFGASDIALRFPGSFFLIPGFVNRLNFGFGYGESFLRSPQYEYDRTWSWTGSARYSLPPLPQWGVSPFSWLIGGNTILVGPYSQWKITPLPTQVSFAISATRGRDHSLNRLSTLSFPSDLSDAEAIQEILNSRVPLINRVFYATRGMQINWKPFEGGMLSPAFDYSLDVSSNLVPLETRAQLNGAVHYDANGNIISADYDSVYYYQRSVQDIMRDIFFKDGQLARPGVDFNASQKVHMGTQPRLPGLFGLEKLLKPVFDYRVEYRWLNTQTNLQNAKQGAWNNTITTGIELNVRDLGMMIFGKPIGEEQGGIRGRGRERGELGVLPEEFHGRSGEERESPGAPPNQQPRNPVERGEQMRIQSPGNPLGRKLHILDTMKHEQPGISIDMAGKIHTPGMGTEGEKGGEFAVDTILTPEAPVLEVPEVAETPSITVKGLLQALVQKPLFDWNGTRFNFTQTNLSLNNALAGDNSGITNFLARGVFSPEDDQNGPSRAYQLGLITDPSGRLLFHWQNHFPFLWYSVRPGLRQGDPFGGSVDVTDAFTETNNFELATSRPLWNGASINLNWKLSFGYDERDALHINNLGDPNLLYQIKSGDVTRTFFSIPPLPFIGESALQSGILNVGVKYRQAVEALGWTVANAHDSLPPDVHNRIERDAFMQGFETLPFFSSVLREFLPRVNYSFSWSGLEKFPLFWFADHASVRNAYNGTYKRSFRQDPGDSLNLTSLQTVVYGFRPLIAFDMSWDKIWNGQLTTSLNYDTQTEWAADYASTRITKRLSTTFGINAHYTRAGGLSIPFLKLNLKNQFGAQFMFSQTISSDDYYNFWTIESNPAGTSNGGITKTTIEPRISYTISSQVSVEGFYHYERTTPASSGLISPPTRLITAGIDMRLKIM